MCVHGHAFFGGDPCSEIVENTVGVLLVHENKYATIFLNEPVKNRHINGNFAMMMVKNLILGAMAFGCMAMIISACGGKRARGEKSRRPVVAVSIPPQQFFIDNIAGDRVETVCLLGRASDPESFEPSMKQFVDLEKARVYMPVGVFAFERVLTDRLKSNRPDLRIINVTDGIEAIYDTHDHRHDDERDHDSHGEADPHMWSSAVNAKIIALNTLDVLIEVDSINEDVYRANYARLESRLDSVDGCFRRLFDGRDDRPSFAVWHPSLSYFARDYGLKQVALVDVGKESSVKALSESMKNAGVENCRIYFYQQEFDSDKAAGLVKENGFDVVTINPMNREWEDEMQKLYDAFSDN